MIIDTDKLPEHYIVYKYKEEILECIPEDMSISSITPQYLTKFNCRGIVIQKSFCPQQKEQETDYWDEAKMNDNTGFSPLSSILTTMLKEIEIVWRPELKSYETGDYSYWDEAKDEVKDKKIYFNNNIFNNNTNFLLPYDFTYITKDYNFWDEAKE